jgi:hypothetical protein
MEISRQEAQRLLDEANNVAADTMMSVAGGYAGPTLVLWGVVMIAAYLGTHFFLKWAWQIWMVLDGVGAAGTIVICLVQFRRSKATRYQNVGRVGWRVFCFWSAIFGYMSIWLYLMKPYSGLQLNAFIVTVVMFAYVMMGLYEGSRFMLWLGLVVTALTLVGVYIVPHKFYCLWMAPAAGGALLLSGIYYWLRAKRLCRNSMN